MKQHQTLELIIDSRDENVVGEIESSLASLHLTHSKTARSLDPQTILGIAAGTVKLINELLALKKSLTEGKIKAKVKVRNLDGKTIDLDQANHEELTKLVD